ncbi:NO signaling/Golgi transport ligand-binding domain-containing protein [Absidia repens]|uniref:Trafficking protein particle complex subunit n=1 Tax=Absidia repens TaxID=90262 RepID=A0A1X2I798_9FUNG|nr:NO signaling/Golgi transport ligand-binding domain-containing protein [Absidia repens]
MLQYTQKRVNGIQDLERKLNEFGYRIGARMLELLTWREKVAKRETRVLGVLYFIHNVVWKALFGKQADSLEKSTENEDEYMISDNDPILTRYISVPKELSQLNCNAFIAGIVEACLDGYQFPARVTAHTVPVDGFPQRTTILIKLDKDVLQREELLK